MWHGVVIEDPALALPSTREPRKVSDLYSIDENVSGPPFAGTSLVELGEEHPENSDWDPETRTMVPRPPSEEPPKDQDSLRHVFDDPEVVALGLQDAQKSTLRSVVRRMYPEFVGERR